MKGKSPLLHSAPIPYHRQRVAWMFDRLMEHTVPAYSRPLNELGVMGRLVRRSIARLELNPDDVILDAGCGDGAITLYLARHCRFVIGSDISRVGLERARSRAAQLGLANAIFDYGALEEPSAQEPSARLNLNRYGINKILILRALHHLPDDLKRQSLRRMIPLLHRPGRMVIGDLIFFESPDGYRDGWDDVHYDGGLTDRPATAEFMIECLTELGGEVEMDRIHPLLGVVVARFGNERL